MVFSSGLSSIAAEASCQDHFLPLLENWNGFPYRWKKDVPFPEADRQLIVLEYNIKVKPGERNKDRILRLVYVLMDKKNGRVIWSMSEFPKHLPEAVTLDPSDPDVLYIAKKVEQFLPAEEADSRFTPHRSYPGLSSNLISEVLRVYIRDGQLFTQDLHNSNEPITALSIKDGTLTIQKNSGSTKISIAH